jgi:hypothetical protein
MFPPDDLNSLPVGRRFKFAPCNQNFFPFGNFS